MAQRRGRACIPCSKIKIKCELGSIPSANPPCERCMRLSKDCELVPIRRSKDRVAELELQVATLTRLLRNQQLQDAPTNNSGTPESSAQGAIDAGADARVNVESYPTTQHGHRRAGGDDDAYPSTSYSSRLLEKIDHIVPQALQQQLLEEYFHVFVPVFPLVRPAVSDISLGGLRSNQPLLLLAIMYATAPRILASNPTEKLSMLLLYELHDLEEAQTKPDVQYLHAVQITSLWHRTPKTAGVMSAPELARLNSSLTRQFGPSEPFALGFSGNADGDATVESVIAWRACLTSYIICACTSVLIRQANIDNWDTRKERSLFVLDYAETELDQWVAQYARAEHLMAQVVQELDTSKDINCDVSDPLTQQKIKLCRDKILNWKMQIPKSQQVPTILFWEHVATVYMIEHVLYTATNKATFSAPFVPDRLSVTDFPHPVLTESHETSLKELNDALYNVIDIFSSFDTPIITALPGLLFGTRAVYALYLLAKLYISLSAKGNTYGAFLRTEDLHFHECVAKLQTVKERLAAYGDTSSAAYRIFGGITRTSEWISNFEILQTQQTQSSSATMTPLAPSIPGLDIVGSGLDGQSMLLDDDIWEAFPHSAYPTNGMGAVGSNEAQDFPYNFE